ncbi:MAG: extracellular solute-binding protein [Oscillospiraceae bacterium]|jgi:putative aldouronate transport system substrate-binding protein|nr:extracellular solute-binding protein [Oscillospiraceae bacterium]
MKKTLAILLTLALLLPAAFVMAESTKEIDVMVWYRDIDDLYFNEMPYYNDLEFGITAQSGVHADFNQVKGADWTTKANLMLASGEYPDVIMHGGINLEMYGVDQGILLPLDEYIKQYMPNYQALLDADPDLAQTLRSSDGKMYQIGWLIPQNINTDSHLFINKAWLDNLGLAVPTTIEEYEAALRAFKEQDANGNGDPNDEIPLGGTYKSMVDGIVHLFSFWGVPFNERYVNINDDMKVSSPLLNENLRAALETVSRWYGEGLIDIEAVAQDTNAFEAKINAEQYGSFWRWRMTAMGTAEEISAKYVCLNPFSVNGVTPQLPRYLEIPSFGAAITAGCEDIEAACKWLDAQLQWDNMINGYNGMYEEFWKYEEDGKVTILPMSDGTRTVPGQSSMYYMDGASYFARVNMPSHRIEKTTYCEAYEAIGAVEKNSWHTLTKLITPNVEESETIELLYAEIQKYADEAITGFIVKGVTDATWETYTKTLGSLRIDEYISMYQQAYDRYLAANQ